MAPRLAPPAPNTAATLPGELRVVLGRLMRRLREQTRAEDLTWSQKSVLLRLEQGAATVTALARAEGVRSQSMGATVATLESAGLVRGVPDLRDGRQTLLSLTDACQKLLRTGRAAREDWLLHAIQRSLTAQEQRALARALPLLERVANADIGSSELRAHSGLER